MCTCLLFCLLVLCPMHATLFGSRLHCPRYPCQQQVVCSVNSQSQKLLEKQARKDRRRGANRGGPSGGQDAELAWLFENGLQPLVEADQVHLRRVHGACDLGPSSALDRHRIQY